MKPIKLADNLYNFKQWYYIHTGKTITFYFNESANIIGGYIETDNIKCRLNEHELYINLENGDIISKESDFPLTNIKFFSK